LGHGGRHPKRGCDHGDERHEARAAACRLQSDVPQRMQRRGAEHQRERESGQKRRLPRSILDGRTQRLGLRHG